MTKFYLWMLLSLDFSHIAMMQYLIALDARSGRKFVSEVDVRDEDNLRTRLRFIKFT
jgi:hypothetical protein